MGHSDIVVKYIHNAVLVLYAAKVLSVLRQNPTFQSVKFRIYCDYYYFLNTHTVPVEPCNTTK